MVKDGVQRIDKWLWFARVVKTRTLAAKLVTGGGVRVNRVRAEAASAAVRLGDVLTIAVAGRVRVLRVMGLGERRGPAPEAALLFEDLTAPVAPFSGAAGPAAVGEAGAAPEGRPPGSGRPTKRDRRRIEGLEPGPGDD